MKIERIHLTLGLVWLLAGMTLGQIMRESGDHGQLATHAHIMLVGGVLSILWAILYRAFGFRQGVLAWIQTIAHQLGAAGMVYSLFNMYGGGQPNMALFGPMIGISGLLVMISVLLILIQSFLNRN